MTARRASPSMFLVLGGLANQVLLPAALLLRGGMPHDVPSDRLQEYCSEHSEELVVKVEEAKQDLTEIRAKFESLNAKAMDCGCCCEEYNDIQVELVYARKDVEYYEGRVETLEKQVDILAALCT
mmetsp:Transcript_43344/g.86114  ORF Transcript_43344/g.86114 Transcript_43344/m.86114 type:complete len:125 (+) Transcript_43344:123-497(+)